MKTYDYLQAETLDVIQFLSDNFTYLKILTLDSEDLYDQLIDEDAITGNGSGSYTFSKMAAEYHLLGNWELLNEAFDELGIDKSLGLENGPEYCDVIIRCYLLDEAIDRALLEFRKKK